MKDFCLHMCVTVRWSYLLTCRMKEWDDLSEYERKDIAEILAKLIVEDYLHPPPSCRFCLRDDCPALKNQGECSAERPLRWLPEDAPSKAANRSPYTNEAIRN
jgi:hypothetical protein